MAVLALILRYRLLTILTLSLIRLKSILRAAWSTEQLVFADFTVAGLDAAAAGGEGIWRSKFREFLLAFSAYHLVQLKPGLIRVEVKPSLC